MSENVTIGGNLFIFENSLQVFKTYIFLNI